VSKVALGFDPNAILVPLDKLLPSRKIAIGLLQSRKYRQILASIREVGVIEPLSVIPADAAAGSYLLLDGHVRVVAMRELGYTEASCLIATDDEGYTYNTRINRVSTVQEHRIPRVIYLPCSFFEQDQKEMITMNQLGRVRRLYYRDGLSLSEIERRTGLTRKTVRTWLRAAEGTAPKYRRRPAEGIKIAPFAAQLTKALEIDARRPKRDRRTALKLFGELQAAGFDGSYSRVSEFVRRWKENGGQALVKAYVPLKFDLGEAFQFDWSEERLVIGGVWRKVIAAHLKLCASRAFVVLAYPTQSHEMLFDAHTQSFTALGGIPRRGIYDNMKTAVDKVKKGKARIVNTRFAAMASHYLFDPDFCNVASGWEKGVVEKNVQDSRRRIWQDAAKERFGSFAELNVWLLARCRRSGRNCVTPSTRT
jgi:transposase